MKKDIGFSRQGSGYKIRKNILNIVLLCILVLACVGYTVFMFTRTNHQYNVRLQETGDEVAKNIHSHMKTAVLFVEGMAETFSNYEDIHSEEAIETLVRVSEKSRFERMWLTKIDGRAISSEHKESDAKGRGYLERAKRGESGISEVQISRVNGEKNVVIFAPTYYAGEVTGMVIGIFKMDTLLNAVDVQCFGGEGRCKIYDSDNRVLISSNNGGTNKGLQSKYSYTTEVGVLDWNVYVSFPEALLQGELRVNIIVTVVLCVTCVSVLGIIIINIFRERNSILAEKARKDSLTKLMNRGTTEKVVDERLLQKGEGESAFAIFDIDKFKGINDSVGHVTGDELLKEVAELMREHFIGADCLSRLGGDEFAVYVEDIEEKERFRQELMTFKKKISSIKIGNSNSTISVGVVFTDNINDTFDSLYRRADKAMYESKRKGGDAVSIYSDIV